jgi:hypothetical protein
MNFEQEINLLKTRIDILEKDKTELLQEKHYQKHLSKLLNGATHLKNKFGITDITNDNCHIEIKNWQNYKACLGQILAYNLGDPKNTLIAAFFGDIKFKDRAIKLMHDNKIDVWELNIISNELLIEKHSYIPKDVQTFIDNHLENTNNYNDKIDIKELRKYITDTKHIPLIGYKLKNTVDLINYVQIDNIKKILLDNYEIGESKDFVKLKDIKETLKKNGIVEKDVITLKYLIEDTFEGVEFKDNTRVNNKGYRNIFIKLNSV